jgi:hypothetical protein
MLPPARTFPRRPFGLTSPENARIYLTISATDAAHNNALHRHHPVKLPVRQQENRDNGMALWTSRTDSRRALLKNIALFESRMFTA